jgi:hypothetical protein
VGFEQVLRRPIGFGTYRLRRQAAMKTAGKENPQPLRNHTTANRAAGRKLEKHPLNQAGWKARKHPAGGKYFFLTFPFIELIRP